jgi:predicted Zn-ribbon and HTH transcriptional regulator
MGRVFAYRDMRASLPHTLRERHRPLADQHRRRSIRPAASAPARVADLAVARVRSAGGPLDEASYACSCGFVFRAPVSTTVDCPHCHAQQAW